MPKKSNARLSRTHGISSTPPINLRSRTLLIPQSLDMEIRDFHIQALAQFPLQTAKSENDFILAAILNGLQVMKANLAEHKRGSNLIADPHEALPEHALERAKRISSKRPFNG